MVATDATVGARIAGWRRRRGMNQSQLADATGLTQPKLSLIEAGTRQLSSAELVAISEALRLDPLDLFEDRPVIENLVGAARGVVVEAGLAEEALSFSADVLRTWRALEEDGFPPAVGIRPEFHPTAPGFRAGKEMALELRGRLDIGDRPLERMELVDVAEQAGLVVIYRRFEGAFDGGCVADQQHCVAVINTATWASRQRFTLAHELAHWLFGDVDGAPVMDDDIFANHDDAESRANAFAAELLVPTPALARLRDADRAAAFHFAFQYGVSLHSLSWRIQNDLSSRPDLARELRSTPAWAAASEGGVDLLYQADSSARGRSGVSFQFEAAVRKAQIAGALSRRRAEALVGPVEDDSSLDD